MLIERTNLADVWLIKPVLHGDNRGYFAETFREDLLNKATGLGLHFIQENQSRSAFGVLRGLHYQKPPFTQTKLVSVTEGRVLDIAVDIRFGSPTFGQHFAIELSAENRLQLLIPRGFAHGFVVLSEHATFCYKVDNLYSPMHDSGIAWNDADLAIDWKLATADIVLSDKDKQQPTFAMRQQDFIFGEAYYG